MRVAVLAIGMGVLGSGAALSDEHDRAAIFFAVMLGLCLGEIAR